jgi:hypothetical protein
VGLGVLHLLGGLGLGRRRFLFADTTSFHGECFLLVGRKVGLDAFETRVRGIVRGRLTFFDEPRRVGAGVISASGASCSSSSSWLLLSVPSSSGSATFSASWNDDCPRAPLRDPKTPFFATFVGVLSFAFISCALVDAVVRLAGIVPG